VKKRQAAFEKEFLNFSPHSSVIRGAWAGWNCLSLRAEFISVLNTVSILLDYLTFENAKDNLSLNVSKEIPVCVT